MGLNHRSFMLGGPDKKKIDLKPSWSANFVASDADGLWLKGPRVPRHRERVCSIGVGEPLSPHKDFSQSVTMCQLNARGPFIWSNLTKYTMNRAAWVLLRCLYSDRAYSAAVHPLLSCLFEMSFYFDGVHDSAGVSVICCASWLNEPQCLYLWFWWSLCRAGCLLRRMLLMIQPIVDILIIIN